MPTKMSAIIAVTLAAPPDVTRVFNDGSPLTIHFIPHSHDDVGWLDTVENLFQNQHDYASRDSSVRAIINTVVHSLRAGR